MRLKSRAPYALRPAAVRFGRRASLLIASNLVNWFVATYAPRLVVADRFDCALKYFAAIPGVVDHDAALACLLDPWPALTRWRFAVRPEVVHRHDVDCHWLTGGRLVCAMEFS